MCNFLVEINYCYTIRLLLNITKKNDSFRLSYLHKWSVRSKLFQSRLPRSLEMKREEFFHGKLNLCLRFVETIRQGV